MLCSCKKKKVPNKGFLSLFIYYVYSVLPVYMPVGQKRAPDFIIDGSEPPCGYQELNSGPLEGQPMCLTSKTSLQPPSKGFQDGSVDKALGANLIDTLSLIPETHMLEVEDQLP